MVQLVQVGALIDESVAQADQLASGEDGIGQEAYEGSHIPEADTSPEELHKAYLGIQDQAEMPVDRIADYVADIGRGRAAVEGTEDALIAAVFVAAVVAGFGFVAAVGLIVLVQGVPELLEVLEIQQLKVAVSHSIPEQV